MFICNFLLNLKVNKVFTVVCTFSKTGFVVKIRHGNKGYHWKPILSTWKVYVLENMHLWTKMCFTECFTFLKQYFLTSFLVSKSKYPVIQFQFFWPRSKFLLHLFDGNNISVVHRYLWYICWRLKSADSLHWCDYLPIWRNLVCKITKKGG